MSETIRIGKKSKSKYISSVLYAFNHSHNQVTISALGSQISKALDVSEKVVEILENVEENNTKQFQKGESHGIKIKLEREEGD